MTYETLVKFKKIYEKRNDKNSKRQLAKVLKNLEKYTQTEKKEKNK